MSEYAQTSKTAPKGFTISSLFGLTFWTAVVFTYFKLYSDPDIRDDFSSTVFPLPALVLASGRLNHISVIAMLIGSLISFALLRIVLFIVDPSVTMSFNNHCYWFGGYALWGASLGLGAYQLFKHQWKFGTVLIAQVVFCALLHWS